MESSWRRNDGYGSSLDSESYPVQFNDEVCSLQYAICAFSSVLVAQDV